MNGEWSVRWCKPDNFVERIRAKNGSDGPSDDEINEMADKWFPLLPQLRLVVDGDSGHFAVAEGAQDLKRPV